MAHLDLGMAVDYFISVNRRKPYLTELPMLAHLTHTVATMVTPREYEMAWVAYVNPAPAPEDIDWAEMATDLSKWGII